MNTSNGLSMHNKSMFTLVIPTHNRAAMLKRTLAHLLKLDEISECEIIVVNDGSTDETGALLEQFRQMAPAIMRVITLENGGPGRARNFGVRAAQNERILFVDDDVFPRQGMLQSHRQLLDAGYTGSQGLLLWHHEISMTPLIRYIDSRGSQFAFDQVKKADSLDFAYVYTGNFAVQRSAVLNAGGFDESFFNKELKFSAFEDTILGFSLQQNGAKLALNRDAVADHLHDMQEDAYFSREYKVGYCIGRLQKKHPAIARLLGLDRKDFMVEPQVHLLSMMNSQPFLKYIAGHPLRMRLRHREAFCRGFLQFKRETTDTRKRPIQ
jgi:glycosyltransferase involved in cell wall biosynthesis